MDLIDILKQVAEQIQSAPPVLLLIFALNGLGLILKKSPLPNAWIPAVLCGVGIAVSVLTLPLPSGRNPQVILGVMGFLFAIVAWLFHLTLLRRLEKFLPGFAVDDPAKPTEPPKPNP